MSESKTQGTIITIDDSGGTPLTIGEVVGFQVGSAPTDEIDIGSFEDTVVQVAPGKLKAPEITITVNLNPDNAAHEEMRSLAGTDAIRDLIAKHPEGTTNTRTWSVQVMDAQMSGTQNDKYIGVYVLKVKSIEVRSAT